MHRFSLRSVVSVGRVPHLALVVVAIGILGCQDEGSGKPTDGGLDRNSPDSSMQVVIGTGGGAGTRGAGGSAGRGAPLGSTGGTSASGGAPAAGGSSGGGASAVVGTGGVTMTSTGGQPATGGASPATGGAAVGGAGRVGTGGTPTGGATTGGRGTGGASTGGASTGGAPSTGGSGTGGRGTGGSGTGGSGTGGMNAGGATSASLYVVAHPDDELLFMNPDLETDIQAGLSVTTVYLTSGDGGDPNSDWRGRETRVMNAHAGMAGVTDTWTCAAATYATKPTTRCVLAGRPTVKAIFLRILDGSIGSLRTLADTASVGTVANVSGTFSRAELLAVLSAVQAELAPSKVGGLDGTLAHGSDHADHIAAGIFTLDVARADGVARQVTLYQGYSMFEPMFANPPIPAPEPENLTAAQYAEKLRIVMFYQAPPLDDGFDQWCHRMYPFRSSSRAAGPFRTMGGQCLTASGTADGAAVTVATCNAGAAQNWTVGANGRVTGQGGKCLGLASGGTGAVLKTCVPSATDQRWTLLSDGETHGTNDTCLTVTGTAVGAATCAPDMSGSLYQPLASQRWVP